MAADALAPCVTRSSAAMVLTMKNKSIKIHDLVQDYSNKHVDGLVQDWSNSIANALELLQSCIKPWKWSHEMEVTQLCHLSG